MQLKRDTDYALRLLLCAARNADPKGISLQELCRQTLVPRTIAARLCHTLAQENILKENSIESHLYYSFNYMASEKTLFDIIQTTEGTVSLFNVFDRSSEVYVDCKDNLRMIEQWFASGLKQISIQDLSENHNTAAENG